MFWSYSVSNHFFVNNGTLRIHKPEVRRKTISSKEEDLFHLICHVLEVVLVWKFQNLCLKVMDMNKASSTIHFYSCHLSTSLNKYWTVFFCSDAILFVLFVEGKILEHLDKKHFLHEVFFCHQIRWSDLPVFHKYLLEQLINY